MTDVIYERAGAREAAIWGAFSYNGPFGTVHAAERVTLFGLYANTYLHGHNYLNEIETEDLSRLVDTYNNNIAMLTGEEAQAVLDIAAKRYVESVTNQIHAADIVTREKKIDALDAEYDARTDALDADYAAIVTQRAKVQLAWDRAAQKIKDLEARTEIEGVNYQLVEVDIMDQELKAARADLAVIEAGLKGLDIQLAITQTGIDITNTDLKIVESENKVDEIGIEVSETEVKESGVDLDITNAGIALSKSEASGERTKVETQGVAVRVAETGLQTTETKAREHQIDAEISKIDADAARLGLVDSELTIIQADKRVTAAENELLVQKRNLIDSQGENVKVETTFREGQKEIQEGLDDKTLEQDQAEQDFAIGISQKETDFEDDIGDIKVDAFDTKKDLADKIKETKLTDAEDRTALDDSRAEEAQLYSDAAIQAASDIANSNITNTLTHTIGAA